MKILQRKFVTRLIGVPNWKYYGYEYWDVVPDIHKQTLEIEHNTRSGKFRIYIDRDEIEVIKYEEELEAIIKAYRKYLNDDKIR